MPLADPAHSRTSRFWRVAELVDELSTPGEWAVDIGSGEGHLCAELKGHGWRQVAGFDISTTRVHRARRHYPDILFYDSYIEKSIIPEGAVDLAVMDAVIEHLPQPVEVLRTIQRYLKPGGRLVFTTPNMGSGRFRMLGRRWSGMLAPHAHIFLFTQQTLTALLQRAGFEVVAAGSFLMPLSSVSSYVKLVAVGDFKTFAWRTMQDAGGIYSRILRQGGMLYAVARRP